MTANEYQEKALRTKSADYAKILERLSSPQMLDMLHAQLGMLTEVGEFADMLKKHIFYGKPLDKVNLREELGDSQWYHAIAADSLDTTLEDVMITNIAKLVARYPDKFTEHHATTRNLEVERKILEVESPKPKKALKRPILTID